jgi:hypothetical protein
MTPHGWCDVLLSGGVLAAMVVLMVPVQRRLDACVARCRREHPGGHPVVAAVILLVCLVGADLVAAVQMAPERSPLGVLAAAAILPVLVCGLIGRGRSSSACSSA